MINLISKGDLDTGLVKRYMCDTKNDFVELPYNVKEGSTVTIITTGETYKINALGEWVLDSVLGQGEPGRTPVKGEDYFTEDDKAELVDEVLNAALTKPVYDENQNAVFCNGVGIVITKSNDKNIITYNLDVDTQEQIEVPFGVKIYGGGNGIAQKCSYSATSIVMNDGEVESVRGGGLGGCSVGVSSIVINGGIISQDVSGGGANNKSTNDATGNIVGHASIIFNGGSTNILFGGCATGLAHVGSANVEVNGGDMYYAIAGGSNGIIGSSRLNLNGGRIKIAQSVNRGSMGNAVISVCGAHIENLYGGGDTSDISVTGTCERTVLNVFSGLVDNLAIGTYKGIEDTFHVSGKYAPGIIVNEEKTSELNMTEAKIADVIAAVWGNLQ